MDGPNRPLKLSRGPGFVPLAGLLLVLLATLAWPAAATTGSGSDWRQLARSFFPEAEAIGDMDGDPPAAVVTGGGKTLGYVFRTRPIAPLPAYSGKPMDMLVGMDGEGQIVGVRVLEHHEPILLVGIPESRLTEFADQYRGKSVRDRIKVGAGQRQGYVNVDAITGATVTVMVMNEALLRAARKVAAARGIIPETEATQQPPAQVRADLFQPADWKQLTGDGSIRRLHLTRGEVDQAFAGTEAEDVDRARPEEASDTFIDLYYAYLNPPTIGRNLLGESQYNWLMAELKPGEHAIALLANGRYSFKGSGYVRGGIFDRILVRQHDREISFRDLDYHRLSDLYAEGMPDFGEMGIFIVRAEHEFDPGTPWQLELLVKRQVGALDSAFASFTGEYQTPEPLIIRPEPVVPEPMWVSVWRERSFQIGVLVSGLVLLTGIIMLQDWLVRFPRLVVRLRTAYLVYTFVFIGWYLLGQLSVVNVLTFTNAVMHDFKWETFLIDPTMFILWTFVAGSLLFWGRGVYCGWLCPFGALQKLINQAARALKLPQYNLPQFIHDRLWGIKYLILMVLFGISLQSLASAERYAEIEPFKTAITLHFVRDLPFVAYAVGLLVISAFNCKFYCKYLCPLGAALAVPAKLRLVDWLRRRRECGKPCQICANECEIQAIHETGEINPNECHFCLDCQVTYWDAHKCPPLVERRRKRERAMRRGTTDAIPITDHRGKPAPISPPDTHAKEV